MTIETRAYKLTIEFTLDALDIGTASGTWHNSPQEERELTAVKIAELIEAETEGRADRNHIVVEFFDSCGHAAQDESNYGSWLARW